MEIKFNSILIKNILLIISMYLVSQHSAGCPGSEKENQPQFYTLLMQIYVGGDHKFHNSYMFSSYKYYTSTFVKISY